MSYELRMNRKPVLIRIGCVIAALVVSLGIQTSSAADWRQFRGNAANSVATGEKLPVELSGSSIVWKTSLPGRGLSGPIIVGNRVLVSASSGYEQDRLHVICADVETGNRIWERQFHAIGRTMTHEKMCNATPTMASDGERVFAFFSSNDLICLDLNGRLQWFRGLGGEFPNASNSLGMSSSPAVIGTTVIVQVESDAEAFACGIDSISGETKWQIERPRKANWTSPAILPADGDHPALVLLQSSRGLQAVDPDTGHVAWEYTNGASTIPSATVSNGQIVIPSHGLTALRPVGDSFEVLWNSGGLSPSTPSPVVANDVAYVLNSAGVLSAGDTTSGERLWQLRLRGSFSSTPVYAGGYIYAFNEAGIVFVVKPDIDRGIVISELNLGETILCSPAVADGALYIRSDLNLYRISN